MAFLKAHAWKIAIMLLPWQVRWFAEGMSVGGLPWEQGRWALYVSWIPMLMTTYLASRFTLHASSEGKKKDHSLIVGSILLLLPVIFSIYPIASVQWLIQILILVLFGWALLRLEVRREEFLTWTVASIVPHALLGIGQFLTQSVIGSKWLGMASQLPSSLGVSVIESAGRRVLRAYGGFPHPNILGGWLSFGLISLVTLHASRVTPHRQKLLFALCSLFSVALILTFSRSAWIAAALGLTVAFWMLWRKAWTLEDKQRVMSLAAVILVSGGLVTFTVRDLVFVRFSNETRLEQKSTTERTASLSSSWSLFIQHPIFGTGQNTGILALDRAGFRAIPPHLVFLLMLLETGLVGFIGVSILVLRWVRHLGPSSILPLSIILPLALFDHYLWSLWAGQSLVMLVAVMPLTKTEK